MILGAKDSVKAAPASLGKDVSPPISESTTSRVRFSSPTTRGSPPPATSAAHYACAPGHMRDCLRGHGLQMWPMSEGKREDRHAHLTWNCGGTQYHAVGDLPEPETTYGFC